MDVAKLFFSHPSCVQARDILFSVFSLDARHRLDFNRWIGTSSGFMCTSISSHVFLRIEEEDRVLFENVTNDRSTDDLCYPSVLEVQLNDVTVVVSQLVLLKQVILYCFDYYEIRSFKRDFFLSFAQVRKHFNLDHEDLCYTPDGDDIEGCDDKWNHRIQRSLPKRFTDQENSQTCPDDLIATTLAFVYFVQSIWKLYVENDPRYASCGMNEDVFMDFVYMYHFKKIDSKTLGHFNEEIAQFKERFKDVLDMIFESNSLYQRALEDAKRDAALILRERQEKSTRGSNASSLQYMTVYPIQVTELIARLEQRCLYHEGAKIREALSGNSWRSYVAYRMHESVGLADLAESFNGVATYDLDFFLAYDLEYSYLVCTPRAMAVLLCRMVVRSDTTKSWWNIPTRYYLSNQSDRAFGHSLLSYLSCCFGGTMKDRCVKENSPNLWISLRLLRKFTSYPISPEDLFENLKTDGRDFWIVKTLYIAICIDQQWLITREGAIQCESLDPKWSCLLPVGVSEFSKIDSFSELIQFVMNEQQSDLIFPHLYLKNTRSLKPAEMYQRGRRKASKNKAIIGNQAPVLSVIPDPGAVGDERYHTLPSNIGNSCALNISVLMEYYEAYRTLRPKKRIDVDHLIETELLDDSFFTVKGFFIDTEKKQKPLTYLSKYNEGIEMLSTA
jgi:hypothetical protein